MPPAGPLRGAFLMPAAGFISSLCAPTCLFVLKANETTLTMGEIDAIRTVYF